MTVSPHVPVTLIVGAILHICGVLFWPGLMPLRVLGFVLMLSGYLGLLGVLGLDRPLNRLSAILAGYAGVGHLMWLLLEPAPVGFAVTYILALLLAFFATSVAALHREGGLQKAGAFGVASSAVPLVGIVVGHIVLGGFGVLGLGVVQSVGFETWPADVLLALWALGAGLYLGRVGDVETEVTVIG